MGRGSAELRGIARGGPLNPTFIRVVLAVCVFVLFFFARLVWHHDGPLALEHDLTAWFAGRVVDPPQLSPYSLARVPLAIAVQPGEPITFALFLLLIGAASYKVGGRALALVCGVGPALAVILTDFVGKPLVHRTAHDGTALAYPSGHSTSAAAIAASLFIYTHYRHGRRTAWLLAPLLAIIPLATGYAVLALHWHYLFDVPGGYAVGIAIMAAGALVLSERDLAHRRRTSTANNNLPSADSDD